MTRQIDELKAGVVGTGFIGAVHVDALRRLGVEVTGVVGSTPERARTKRLAPA
jgi:predicted dehydrogenase